MLTILIILVIVIFVIVIALTVGIVTVVLVIVDIVIARVRKSITAVTNRSYIHNDKLSMAIRTKMTIIMTTAAITMSIRTMTIT